MFHLSTCQETGALQCLNHYLTSKASAVPWRPDRICDPPYTLNLYTQPLHSLHTQPCYYKVVAGAESMCMPVILGCSYFL